jgi:hypothetical protein
MTLRRRALTAVVVAAAGGAWSIDLDDRHGGIHRLAEFKVLPLTSGARAGIWLYPRFV